MIMGTMYANLDPLNKAVLVLWVVFVDASLSMRKRGLLKPAIEGVNKFLAALKDSQSHACAQVAILGMNGSITPDFVPLDEIKEVSESDFPEVIGSPIADRLGEILDTAEQAIADSFSDLDNPGRKRFYLALAIDGEDAVRTEDNRVCRASQRYSDEDIAERLHRFCQGDNEGNAIAIGDGDAGLQVEAALICLGFDQQQIIPAGATPHDIRAAFKELTRRSLKLPGA